MTGRTRAPLCPLRPLPHDRHLYHRYRAFSRFVELLHSEEFERKIPMERGRFLLMHNWRVLHGRAGAAASANRMVVGGTITREAFYSQARCSNCETHTSKPRSLLSPHHPPPLSCGLAFLCLGRRAG